MRKEIINKNEENKSKKDRWEAKPMNSKFLSKLLIAGGMMIAMSSTALAAQATYDENDVTPPWGRIVIQGATEVNNINYVDREQITVEIYARDNVSDTIFYYLSTSAISKTSEITNWEVYHEGKTETIDLPNATGTNTIYAVFKDNNGNTSYIYDDSLSRTIVYNLNGGTVGISGVDTTLTAGESHVVTMQRPKWEGHYFLGWSTKSNVTEASYEPGDVIPYAELAGLGDTITLYAIWTTTESGLPLLSSVVKVGDYVNYPVVYDNVPTEGESVKSTYKGWRVIGIEDDGTVNLVSAGVPLTFYRSTNSNDAIAAITTNFLATTFTTSGMGYRKTGFGPYLSLSEVFKNEYTELNTNGVQKVRSITLDDVTNATGITSFSSTTPLGDASYENLFAVNAYYFFASKNSDSELWMSDKMGRLYKSSYLSGKQYEYGMRPVVSLKSDVRASGKDMIDAWNIVMP